MTQPSDTYTLDDVREAANTAANTLIARLGLDDQDGKESLVNLMVNATLGFLAEPTTDLDAIIAHCHTDTVEEVLSWSRGWL